MGEFMKENFVIIVMAIVVIFGFSMLFHSINKKYEFYEKVLEYGIESNTAVEIK